MRFIRSIALVASVVLLVGTFLAILDRRDELRQSYDDQVSTASVAVTAGVEMRIDRAIELAAVAGSDTRPAELARLGDGVEVCIVGAATSDCTGDDLSQTPAYDEALAESGDVVALADADSDAVLVVAEGEQTVVIRLPAASLVTATIEAIVEQYAPDVDVEIEVTDDETGHSTDGVVSVGGERVMTTAVVEPPVGGAVDVTSSIDRNIGLTGDNTSTYLALLLLGAVLLAVVGWTLLAERRSLERQATTDEMTGLLNRREFERQSEEAMLNAERFRTGLCIMLIDLDGFKGVNDTRGHHVGDEVLVECAHRLRSAVRDTDVVGRWGGDEFVILLPGLEQATAVRNSAERIGASIADTPLAPGVSLTASIGAALYPRHGHNFDDLIRAADGAMYGAKTTGVTHRLADALSSDDPSGSAYTGSDRRRSPTG
jgi:diguanylate cyclase (GGDEF)-like protein